MVDPAIQVRYAQLPITISGARHAPTHDRNSRAMAAGGLITPVSEAGGTQAASLFDALTALGVALTVLGLAFTVWQVVRTRSAAEAARDAVRDRVSRTVERDIVSALRGLEDVENQLLLSSETIIGASSTTH